jgi:thiosulfate/3-mercaptopyruvate sulfurtransferase
MTPQLPEFLIETDQLEAIMMDPELRIIDITMHLDHVKDYEVTIISGRSDWDAAHIPGSVYIDLKDELSETDNEMHFMMPSVSQFKRVMERHGVDSDAPVVVYDQDNSFFAARLWWMFQAMGFQKAAVLNGGWKKWTMEKRAITSESLLSRDANFVPQPNLSLFVDKDEVIQCINDPNVCIICALDEDQYKAEHIPNSKNIGSITLRHDHDNTLLPKKELKAIFDSLNCSYDKRILTYCGGGIAAACCAFALKVTGYNNVAIYDGSMVEWSSDPNLPIEKG